MKLFGVFGNPIKHSKSPLMHNNAFIKLGFDASYIKILLDDGEKLKERFFELGLYGANVTVPFKENAYLLADEVRGVAKEIKAVNTLVLEDNKLIAYNTDGDGFLMAIEEFGAKKVLILGAGGTSKAISRVLQNSGYDVLVANRSETRLKEFESDIKTTTYLELKEFDFDLVVNSTSAGLSDELLPIDIEILRKIFQNSKAVFDCIYRETSFLKLAKEMNLKYKNGQDMLLYQGVLAFDLFTQKRFKQENIIRFMREALEKFS
jgi:shikimate dehydrogenase